MGCSVLGLLTINGLAIGQAIAMPLSNSPQQSESTSTSAPEETPQSQAFVTPAMPGPRPLSDGTYLYGQSPQANTIGATYMVFDVKGQEVVGAFYMPHSSFDCFHGSFQATDLALTIRDSYEQNEFAYTVPLVEDDIIASTQQSTAVTQHPDGFYPIADLSEMDQHILTTCQAQTW
ncbi:MAG: hypothetical protein F6K30_30405 [Cyanothece sp. SIO2G6]|nr:hypothetical protein [Cyanothece sp. SIO2G6]